MTLQEDARDLDAYTLAKSYFDLKEYDRAAYFLRGCKSQKAYFLYMYSRYLVRQKAQCLLALNSSASHRSLAYLIFCLFVPHDRLEIPVVFGGTEMRCSFQNCDVCEKLSLHAVASIAANIRNMFL